MERGCGSCHFQMDFSQLEEQDGIRMTWNIWPTSKVEATKCVIPFAAIYTPTKRLQNMPVSHNRSLRDHGDRMPPMLQVVKYEPVPCKQCNGILNPYARVDFFSKVWTCPLCMCRNHFPPHYQGVTDQNLPAELYPAYSTLEYTMNRTVQPHPPVYLFVIDTCLGEDELSACKTAVMQAISTLPEYVHVGLITYGRHVHVYELGFTECSKCYVFRGGVDSSGSGSSHSSGS